MQGTSHASYGIGKYADVPQRQKVLRDIDSVTESGYSAANPVFIRARDKELDEGVGSTGSRSQYARVS